MNNNNINAPIGFFDSGVGGLSVYAKFKKLLPQENTIYFGDTKNLPYGNKSKEELISITKNILNFFKNQKVKCVVIACNTSSALTYNEIKNDYEFKIYPIIQSCAKIIAETNIKKIGVFATEGTVNSHAYQNEIKKFNPDTEIFEVACPNWVKIVESGDILKQYSQNDIKSKAELMNTFNPDKIILGCTHYPYLLDVLSKYIDKNIFIDPAIIFTEFIKNDLLINNMLNTQTKNGDETFYVSSSPDKFATNAKAFYQINNTPALY